MNLYLDFLIMKNTIDDWKRRHVSDVSIANFFKKKTIDVDDIHPIKKNKCVGLGFQAHCAHISYRSDR